MRKPEQVGVKSISAPLERDQSLLHELLLASTSVPLRNGAYTIAHVVPRNTRGLVSLFVLGLPLDETPSRMSLRFIFEQIPRIHSQAFLAFDELRVLVLSRKINNVHPVALFVQSGLGSDILRSRRAQGDDFRIRLSFHTVALKFRVAQQRVHAITSRRYLVTSRIPVI